MAGKCMLCDKKIGFFDDYCEDIIKGISSNKICKKCNKQVEYISSLLENDTSFNEEVLETFSNQGKVDVLEYFCTFPNFNDLFTVTADGEENDTVIDEIENEEEAEDTVTDPKLNSKPAEEILETIINLSEEQIDDYLEKVLGEGYYEFSEDILSLNNEELAQVVNDQREYYNNYEWAYIMLVDRVRNGITEDEEIILPDFDTTDIDETEVNRLKAEYEFNNKDELLKIILDDGFTTEARIAAKELYVNYN